MSAGIFKEIIKELHCSHLHALFVLYLGLDVLYGVSRLPSSVMVCPWRLNENLHGGEILCNRDSQWIYTLKTFCCEPALATTMADNKEEDLSESQKREENARIYKALSSLRRCGAAINLGDTDERAASENRIWGTLQFDYPSEQSEARIHACLKPFLYRKCRNADEEITAALFRIGAVPMMQDGQRVQGVYSVRGSVEGVYKIQIFVTEDKLEEYMLMY